MEQIINFLEQYWGYTIVGGATFGTIITFIVTQIKSLLNTKLQNSKLANQSKEVDKLMGKIEDLCEQLSVKEIEKQEVYKQLELEQKKNIAKEQYFEQVQATTFKAISYLVMASKLPYEEKITLQQQFDGLAKPKLEQYTETLKEVAETAVETIKEEIVDDAAVTVEETLNKTKSLLDKYTGA